MVLQRQCRLVFRNWEDFMSAAQKHEYGEDVHHEDMVFHADEDEHYSTLQDYDQYTGQTYTDITLYDTPVVDVETQPDKAANETYKPTLSTKFPDGYGEDVTPLDLLGKQTPESKNEQMKQDSSPSNPPGQSDNPEDPAYTEDPIPFDPKPLRKTGLGVFDSLKVGESVYTTEKGHYTLNANEASEKSKRKPETDVGILRYKGRDYPTISKGLEQELFKEINPGNFIASIHVNRQYIAQVVLKSDGSPHTKYLKKDVFQVIKANSKEDAERLTEHYNRMDYLRYGNSDRKYKKMPPPHSGITEGLLDLNNLNLVNFQQLVLGERAKAVIPSPTIEDYNGFNKLLQDLELKGTESAKEVVGQILERFNKYVDGYTNQDQTLKGGIIEPEPGSKLHKLFEQNPKMGVIHSIEQVKTNKKNRDHKGNRKEHNHEQIEQVDAKKFGASTNRANLSGVQNKNDFPSQPYNAFGNPVYPTHSPAVGAGGYTHNTAGISDLVNTVANAASFALSAGAVAVGVTAKAAVNAWDSDVGKTARELVKGRTNELKNNFMNWAQSQSLATDTNSPTEFFAKGTGSVTTALTLHKDSVPIGDKIKATEYWKTNSDFGKHITAKDASSLLREHIKDVKNAPVDGYQPIMNQLDKKYLEKLEKVSGHMLSADAQKKTIEVLRKMEQSAQPFPFAPKQTMAEHHKALEEIFTADKNEAVKLLENHVESNKKRASNPKNDDISLKNNAHEAKSIDKQTEHLKDDEKKTIKERLKEILEMIEKMIAKITQKFQRSM